MIANAARRDTTFQAIDATMNGRRAANTAWPILEEMGITRFDEISHYALRQDGARQDILKVHYKRAKGSLLPVTRKYRFGRSQRTLIADGGSGRLEDTYEISPYLLGAIAELDALIEDNRPGDASMRRPTVDAKNELMLELGALRREAVRGRTAAQADALQARFTRFEVRLEAL